MAWHADTFAHLDLISEMHFHMQLEEHSKHFDAFDEIPSRFCDVFSFSFVEQKEKKSPKSLTELTAEALTEV